MFKHTYTINYSIKKPKSEKAGIYIASLVFDKPLKRGSDEFTKMLMLLSKAHNINQALISVDSFVRTKRSLNLPKLNLRERAKNLLALFA